MVNNKIEINSEKVSHKRKKFKTPVNQNEFSSFLRMLFPSNILSGDIESANQQFK